MSSGFITTTDGVRIFYKDWGPKDAQPIVFHHGWPLSADDWDSQMLFFRSNGYRVIAHDRRGHGRSTQTDTGNEMDTYAADVIELAAALDLKNAVHVVAVADLTRPAMTAPVVSDDAKTLAQEIKELRVPVVGTERPAVVKDQRLRVSRAPVLVEHLDAVLGSDHRHVILLV